MSHVRMGARIDNCLRSAGIAAATLLGVCAWSPTAHAHAYLVDPPPRDALQPITLKDGHKTGPCGGLAKGTPSKKYAVGQQITISLAESIDHIGCFQATLSNDNDVTFNMFLGQLQDPDDGTIDRANPLAKTLQVTLPAGVSCQNCTLQLRQLMLSSEVPARNIVCPMNPQPVGNTPTYYSCADIQIGDFDGGVTPVDAGTSNDAGTTPTDDGGGGGGTVGADGGSTGGTGGTTGPRANPTPRSTNDGCTVAPGTTPSLVTLGAFAVFVSSMFRRRRR